MDIVPDDSQSIRSRPSPSRGGGNKTNNAGDSLAVPMPFAHAGSALHPGLSPMTPAPSGYGVPLSELDSSDGASAPPFGTPPVSQPIDRPDSPMGTPLACPVLQLMAAV
ncbi:hypothetical protein AcV5_010465 [Taiwanofungus camphoratus]|nr:hypothetical protein AcV5_010465 [Antrodia cinnamomea]